jgi:hypothetical protein
VASGIAEHGDQRIGRAVGDFALLRERVAALREHRHVRDRLDALQAAGGLAQDRERADRGDLRGSLRLRKRHAGARAAFQDHRGIQARDLPAHVDGVAAHDERHVVSADLDLGVEIETDLGGDAAQRVFTAGGHVFS